MDWFGFSGRGSGMGEVPPACSYSYYLAYDIYIVAEVSDMALLLLLLFFLESIYVRLGVQNPM